MKARWGLPLFVLAVIVILLGVLRGLERAPVSVVPASDRSGFSAERAFAHLQTLLAENVPHPSGSAANALVADRIVAALRAVGYEPEVQEGFKCSTLAPGCSVVRNIIATRKGRDSTHAVMVTAHYDSVPGSAAAADDGAGVAAMLEIAERIAAREPLLHDVVFLFADAEETGLRGAMHFADSHPLMKRIAFVLNMEARGVSGPSLMFETGANNAALISLFADAVPNPVSNSLLFEAYRRMPNNTDFTVYKWQQVSGLNFAFSRGAALYHSQRDDLAHLDKASLQHQGDNVSAALSRIADTPVEALAANGDATYFDIGGQLLPRWPSAWNPVLAGIGLVLVLVAGVRRAQAGWRACLWCVAAIVGLIVLIVVAGWLLSWPLGRWPEVHPLDHPYPWPARIALIASTIAATFVLARVTTTRADSGAALTVVWVMIALLTLAVSLTVPGMSYLFLVPLLVYGTGAAIESFAGGADRGPTLVAAAAGFVVAAYMALYHFVLLDVMFNFDAAHAKTIPLVLLALPLFPITIAYAAHGPVRVPVVAALAVVAAAAVTAMFVPTHTIDRPRGVNLVYVQDDTARSAQWQLESLGDPGRETIQAMAFDSVKQPGMRFGVVPTDMYMKPAVNQELAAPVVEIAEDIEAAGKRTIRGSVRSQRSTHRLGLAFAAQAPVLGLSVEGQPVLEKAASDARLVGFHGVGEQPVRFELVARAGELLTVTAFDIGALTPDREAEAMLARRPDTAAPLHSGNQSIVLTRLSLEPTISEPTP